MENLNGKEISDSIHSRSSISRQNNQHVIKQKQKQEKTQKGAQQNFIKQTKYTQKQKHATKPDRIKRKYANLKLQLKTYLSQQLIEQVNRNTLGQR